MHQRFTKSVVESVEKSPRDIIVWDRDLKGFGLKVTPTGRKVYFVYYRTRAGQQRKPSIGLHGQITSEEARQIAKRWIAAALGGEDISRERQDARSAPTIADLAKRYLEEYAKHYKKASSCKTDRSNIEHHVLPLLGCKKVAEVTRGDIEAMKSAIREGKTARRLKARKRGRTIVKGGLGVANRVIALVSKMMTCAVRWELRGFNPVLGTEKYPEKRKDRFLDASEICRLIRALRQAEQQGSETPMLLPASCCFCLLDCGQVRFLA